LASGVMKWSTVAIGDGDKWNDWLWLSVVEFYYLIALINNIIHVHMSQKAKLQLNGTGAIKSLKTSKTRLIGATCLPWMMYNFIPDF